MGVHEAVAVGDGPDGLSLQYCGPGPQYGCGPGHRIISSLAQRHIVLSAHPAIRFVLLGLCVAMSACSPRKVSLYPTKASYHPGETATFELRNNTPEEVRYNNCRWTMERRSAEGWETFYTSPPPEIACLPVGRILAVRSSTRFQITLPATVADGTYRIRFPNIGNITTDEFQVTAPR